MKKLLLLSALAVSALAVNAEGMGDYFKFTYEGKELTDGQEIVVTDYEDYTDIEDGYTYACDITIVNVQGKTAKLFGALEYTDQPTYEMMAEAAKEGSPSKWGNPMLCLTGNCFAGTPEYAGSATVDILAESAAPQEWNIHLASIASTSTVSKYTLFLSACDDEGERLDDADMTINLVFGSAGNDAVEEINVANAAPIYYNLQGQKVNNPEKGIYLVKRAGKFTKEVVR